MRPHRRDKKNKASLYLRHRRPSLHNLPHLLPVIDIDRLTVQQVQMFLIQIPDRCRKHPVSALKRQPVHIFQRQKHRRVLIHPSAAQLRILRHRQSLKQRRALSSHIKKTCQHTHAQRLSKPARPGDQSYSRRFRPYDLCDHATLVNIIISIFTNLLKVRDSDRDAKIAHEDAPFFFDTIIA